MPSLRLADARPSLRCRRTLREAVRVVAPGRVHLGLLQLSDSYTSINMGIGFGLDEPQWVIDVEQLAGDEPDVFRGPWAHEAISAARRLLTLLRTEVELPSLQLTRVDGIPPHTGLGSKTSMLCAVLAGSCHFLPAATDWRGLRHLTERGGTSGIGINVCALGGAVLDLGHRVAPSITQSFGPSSRRAGSPAPRVGARFELPAWDVLVARPTGAAGVFGQAEAAVFDRNTPIPHDEADKLAALVLYELLPAFADGDAQSCARAVARMQATGFKGAEWRAQPIDVLQLRDRLVDLGAPCVALSSMGPSLVAIGNDLEPLYRRASQELSSVELCLTHPSNSAVAVSERPADPT